MAPNVAVHTISFRGKAGAIFVLLCCAVVCFIVGYVTVGWSFSSAHREGLWETCTCGKQQTDDDWFHAVQAMLSIGLVMLLLSLLLITIYMCVHTVSKNSTIIALVCFCFLAVIFMLIGCIIYGVKRGEDRTLSWSFGVSLVSTLLALVAGIVSVVQLRSSGVHV